MRYKLLFIFLFCKVIGYSQEFTIEKVKFTDPRGIEGSFEFPRLKSSSKKNKAIVEKINSTLLEGLMLESYIQKNVEDLNWLEFDFSSEIEEDILHLTFSGFYLASYSMYVEETYFFDLKTGERLRNLKTPFHSLFSLTGYLDFLNKYWLDSVTLKFEEAQLCAEEEPPCSLYDISGYRVENNRLEAWLTNNCFEYYNDYCTPSYRVSIDLDSLRQHLSNIGKYILLESNYFSSNPIEKFKMDDSLSQHPTRNLFMFAEIDNKYPISLAINIDKQDQISGYYYYNNNRVNIILNGKKEKDVLKITETHKNKITGCFEFIINTEYGYIESGKWSNPKKTVTYDIEVTEVKSGYKFQYFYMHNFYYLDK